MLKSATERENRSHLHIAVRSEIEAIHSFYFRIISQFSPNATRGYSHSDDIFEPYQARSTQAKNLKYADRPGQISQITVREPSLRKSPLHDPFNCKYRVSMVERDRLWIDSRILSAVTWEIT